MANINLPETTAHRQPSIAYPLDWAAPKYHFGQYTTMGQIIGVEYYASDALLAHQYGRGWRYTILPNKNADEVCYCLESDICLLSPEEAKTKLESEISFYQLKMEAIALQLKEIQAVHQHLSAA